MTPNVTAIVLIAATNSVDRKSRNDKHCLHSRGDASCVTISLRIIVVVSQWFAANNVQRFTNCSLSCLGKLLD